MTMTRTELIEAIAKAVHDGLRYYRRSIGEYGCPPWDSASEDLRDESNSRVRDTIARLTTAATMSNDELQKEAEEFNSLPRTEQVSRDISDAIVAAFMPLLTSTPAQRTTPVPLDELVADYNGALLEFGRAKHIVSGYEAGMSLPTLAAKVTGALIDATAKVEAQAKEIARLTEVEARYRLIENTLGVRGDALLEQIREMQSEAASSARNKSLIENYVTTCGELAEQLKHAENVALQWELRHRTLALRFAALVEDLPDKVELVVRER